MLKSTLIALVAGIALLLPIKVEAQTTLEIFACESIRHFDKFTFTADRKVAPELGLLPGEPYDVILEDGTPGAVQDIKAAILANLGFTLEIDVARLRRGLDVIDVEYSNLCDAGIIAPGTTPG